MTEKKTFLSENDLCLYCAPDGNRIYYNTKYKYFFEYLKFQGKEYVFALAYDEAKEELQALKPFLTVEQKEKCKEIWSDF